MGSRSRPAVGGVAITLAVLLAACGGSSVRSVAPVKHAPSAKKIVLDSVVTTTSEKSARVEMTVASAGSFPVATTLSGVTDFATGDSELTMHLAGAAAGVLSGDIVERTVNNVMYMQLPAALHGLPLMPPGAKWMSMGSFGAAPPGAGIFPGFGQSDPKQLLAYLEAVSNDVKTVGTEQVRGVETTHYHALLDLGKAIDKASVPPTLRSDLAKILSMFTKNPSSFPVDIWVDAEGRVRKVTEHIDFGSLGASSGVPSGATGPTGADSAMKLTTSLEMYDFGVPVNVQAPPADQVTKLPSSFGDLGGPSGSSGATGSSS